MDPQLIPRKTIGEHTIYERKPKPRFVSKFVVFKGEQQVQDFSRYSLAVLWCKSRSQRPVPNVVIYVEGGLVQHVLSDVPLNYTLLDRDHDHDEPGGRYVAVSYGEGSEVCHVGMDNAIVDPERIALILKSIRPVANSKTPENSVSIS